MTTKKTDTASVKKIDLKDVAKNIHAGGVYAVSESGKPELVQKSQTKGGYRKLKKGGE